MKTLYIGIGSAILGLICVAGITSCSASKAQQITFDTQHGVKHGALLGNCENEANAAAIDAGWLNDGGQAKGRAAAIAANEACLAKLKDGGQ